MLQTDILDRYNSIYCFGHWSLWILVIVSNFVLRISDLSKPPREVKPLELALRLQIHRFNRWILYLSHPPPKALCNVTLLAKIASSVRMRLFSAW
jgi:hypothetical protein